MFLDDERHPPRSWHDGSFIIMRSTELAKVFCTVMYVPDFISFDHDLGENKLTGYDFAHWLVEQDISKAGFLPDIFSFTIHSMNPVGAQNITILLNNYLQFRKENKT